MRCWEVNTNGGGGGRRQTERLDYIWGCSEEQKGQCRSQGGGHSCQEEGRELNSALGCRVQSFCASEGVGSLSPPGVPQLRTMKCFDDVFFRSISSHFQKNINLNDFNSNIDNYIFCHSYSQNNICFFAPRPPLCFPGEFPDCPLGAFVYEYERPEHNRYIMLQLTNREPDSPATDLGIQVPSPLFIGDEETGGGAGALTGMQDNKW